MLVGSHHPFRHLRLGWQRVRRLGRQPDEYTDDYSGSDFMEAASGVDLDGFMRVMDEHMEGLRIVFPKEYDSVMEKIRSLPSVVM